MKAHESKVNEIAKETRISLGGPLALVAKISRKEFEKVLAKKEKSDEEGLIVNSDDEAMAFYLNNRV